MAPNVTWIYRIPCHRNIWKYKNTLVRQIYSIQSLVKTYLVLRMNYSYVYMFSKDKLCYAYPYVTFFRFWKMRFKFLQFRHPSSLSEEGDVNALRIANSKFYN